MNSHFDTAERPLVCAACDGPINPGQRTLRPEGDDDPRWIMHAAPRDCWNSVLLSYINSEHPDDIARARGECAERGIDYAAARDAKLRAMAAEGRALLERQASGESPTHSGRER